MKSWLNLLFPEYTIDDILLNKDTLIVKAHQPGQKAACPRCQQQSHRVHSYYTRKPQDLPISGFFVRLYLKARRFLCLNQACQQVTFAERWGQWLAPYARKTTRIKQALYHIGQVAGGAGGSRLLTHLKMLASGSTLIRLIRSWPMSQMKSPRVLGVDDWAYRKGRTYGTIIVDLERAQVIDLLPDRKAATLATWLQAQPDIQIVARDRSREYGRGIDAGAPQAQQVADRWHLLLNMRQMLARYLRQIYGRLSQLPPVASPVTESARVRRGTFVRTRQEKVASQKSRARRLQRYHEIQRRRQAGENISGIAQTLSLHRETVRTYYYAEQFPERNRREPKPSILDEYVPYLEIRWAAGCENGKALWREIRNLGYPGNYSQVNKWLKVRRRQPASRTPHKWLSSSSSSKSKPDLFSPSSSLPSAKKLAYLLGKRPEALSAKEAEVIKRILQEPQLAILYPLVQQFHHMIREQKVVLLDTWLQQCAASDIPRLQTFADGIRQDYQAVSAALQLPWSSGPTEGHINRLKLIKRQMFGRAKLDLLKRKVLYASQQH